MLPSLGEVFNFIKYPWITNTGSSNHNTVYTVTIFIFYSFFRGIDIAIRTGDMKDSGLKTRYLATVRRVLVASPGYIKSRISPGTPADLADWDWILFSMLPSVRNFTSNRGEQRKLKFDSRISVDNADALCHLAISGLGLATPPEFLVEDELHSGQLVEVLPDWQLQHLIMQLVWPANSPRESLTARFVDFLVESQANSDRV